VKRPAPRGRMSSIEPRSAKKPARIKGKYPPRAETQREKEVEKTRQKNEARLERQAEQERRFGGLGKGAPMRRVKDG
jgi:hypothetical protein